MACVYLARKGNCFNFQPSGEEKWITPQQLALELQAQGKVTVGKMKEKGSWAQVFYWLLSRQLKKKEGDPELDHILKWNPISSVGCSLVAFYSKVVERPFHHAKQFSYGIIVLKLLNHSLWERDLFLRPFCVWVCHGRTEWVHAISNVCIPPNLCSLTMPCWEHSSRSMLTHSTPVVADKKKCLSYQRGKSMAWRV